VEPANEWGDLRTEWFVCGEHYGQLNDGAAFSADTASERRVLLMDDDLNMTTANFVVDGRLRIRMRQGLVDASGGAMVELTFATTAARNVVVVLDKTSARSLTRLLATCFGEDAQSVLPSVEP
jgi:hypothetical protein